MKVLHVGEYAQGGVATYIRTLLSHPEYPDIEDFLICSEKNSERDWPISKENIIYYSYSRNLMSIIPAIRAIKTAIDKIKPDVIYCHSTWAGLFVRLPQFVFSKKYRIIYNPHGWSFLRDTTKWKKNIYALIERILLLKTDKIINVSYFEYNAAKRYGLDSEKQKVIYSGLAEKKTDVDKTIKLSDKKINILFVGRFDPQKGVDYLLNVFNRCTRKDIHLTLIGDNVIGGLQIKKQNTDQITFLGWVPHYKIASYYNACDAVIMPSRWEAFGLVAIEAMKYGKPVIASNRGALPELIDSNAFGCLFDIEKQDTLIDILKSLKKEDLKIKGLNAELVFKEKYRDKRMIHQTVNCYMEVSKL